MAQEQGAFTLEDVAEGICDKMIRRHPHVFGENSHVLDSQALHAWPEVAQVSDKLHEELAELDQARLHRDRDAIEDEMGDVLFSAVNLARHLEVDAETALRRATKKFETRFRQVEALATERELTLSELDIAALESLWQEAKQTLS